MITSLSSFATGSGSLDGGFTDAAGHLTTNTVVEQQIVVPMPVKLQENLSQAQQQQLPQQRTGQQQNTTIAIPSLTLSYSSGSLNDHHLAFCLFEVCLGLREFHIQRGNLPVKERRRNPDVPVSLIGYHDWFLAGFTIWINDTANQVGIM